MPHIEDEPKKNSREKHNLQISSRELQINKPAAKTIQSPDGDIIDCVMFHKQPAFDHPLLKGHKLLNPPKIPRKHNQTRILNNKFQLWSLSGETCSEGTISIRRTKEKEILRATSIRKLGRTFNIIQKDSINNGHEDPPNGNWLLKFGSIFIEEIGYWPSSLFTHLNYKATTIQFGGEIMNRKSTGSHTSTQMGSGHFAEEGFGKASYFKNLQVMDSNRNLIPLPNLQVLASNQNCYNIKGGTNHFMGNYFYYGGPGKNDKCP
ncbi:protein neprosin-like [Cicer arietinum]|uniref:protein neprosin-like n=1 Tax=Cicer arietinum TaxID=3827 RepID=UPI003CC6B72B